MNSKIKTELVSIAHTFLAVMGAAFIANIDSVDFAHLSKEALLSFGIALFRSAIKSAWQMYSVDNSTTTP